MTVLVVMVRRSLWLLLVGAVGGAAYAWWRDRSLVEPGGPAEWPPLPARTPEPPTAATPDATTPAATASEPPASEPATASTPADTATLEPDPAPDASTSSATATASFVNALVDAPEARSSNGERGGWVDPVDDGACPISHPIKANDNSGIFHVPGGRFYDRTKAERCYQSAEAALADGYRQAKN